MDIDARKKRKLSDHALELIMRDVLFGIQEPRLEMQADATGAMAATDDLGLTSDRTEGILGTTNE